MPQVETRSVDRPRAFRVVILQLLAVENVVILSVASTFFTLREVFGVKPVHS